MYLSAILPPNHISSAIRPVQHRLLCNPAFIPAYGFDVLVPLAFHTEIPELPSGNVLAEHPFSAGKAFLCGKSLYYEVSPKKNINTLSALVGPSSAAGHASPPFDLYSGILLGSFEETPAVEFSLSTVPAFAYSWKKAGLAIIELTVSVNAGFNLLESSVLSVTDIVCPR